MIAIVIVDIAVVVLLLLAKKERAARARARERGKKVTERAETVSHARIQMTVFEMIARIDTIYSCIGTIVERGPLIGTQLENDDDDAVIWH